MKKKITYSLLVLTIIGCFLIFFFQNKNRNESAADNEAEPPHGNISSTNEVAAHHPSTKNNLSSEPQISSSDRIKQERLSALAKALSEYSKQIPQPIEFYGKVVDENMQPVEGAGVSFIYNTYRPESSTNASTVSDINGLFSISGVNGITLSVSVGKQGYYALQSIQQFVYLTPPGSEPFHPDSNNPIVFNLRKRGNGVELITSQHGMQPDFVVSAPKDGTPILVDLLQQKIGDSGQIKIQSWLEVDSTTGRTKLWQLKLFISDGGFVEENDQFPFQAPENGYIPELEFPMPDADGNIHFGISQKKYYFAFGSPRLY